jgi:hypothetical protein
LVQFWLFENGQSLYTVTRGLILCALVRRFMNNTTHTAWHRILGCVPILMGNYFGRFHQCEQCGKNCSLISRYPEDFALKRLPGLLLPPMGPALRFVTGRALMTTSAASCDGVLSRSSQLSLVPCVNRVDGTVWTRAKCQPMSSLNILRWRVQGWCHLHNAAHAQFSHQLGMWAAQIT